ncbi:MAG: TldD/PmbA family protein [Desulfurococcales archaeon]|nr:TldD/PmbA family protein [Desulfurococcales archaeon]
MRDPLNIAEEVVNELRKDFDDVIALVSDVNSAMVKFWNTEPSVTQSWLETKVTVYIAKNRKTLYLSLSVSDPEEVVKAVKSSARALEMLEESELYAPLPKPKPWEPLEGLVDKAVVNALNNPKDVAEELVNSALSGGVDRVAGTLTLTHEVKATATSKGFAGREERTAVEAYLRVFKGEMSGHWAYGGRYLDLRKIQEVGEKAAYYATLTSKKADYEPGKYDVVLSPLVVGNLIDYIGFMASAAAVLMGYSMFMKFKVGDTVASDKVTLMDVPRDADLPGSTAFDDEGTPTYDKPIIEKGVLRNLLHNVGTAAKMNASTTGNAGLIFPTPWNLRLSTGGLDEESLAAELGNGIIVNNNWYTRLQNYVEGMFSTVSRDAALLVRNGEIVGHLGRIRIADRFDNLLKNVVDLGKHAYMVKWWEVQTPMKAPYMLVRGLNITKPSV